MKRPRIPPDAEMVRTYDELDCRFVGPFYDDKYNLLIVIGRPGLGKSYLFERLADGDENTCLIKGKSTSFRAYISAYHNIDKRLVFDDAELLWGELAGRQLIRQLCETTPIKHIRWDSAARQLERERIPREFSTRSRIAILANHFTFGGASEYAAIVDRGHLAYFDPTPIEIHRMVGEWFEDREVYSYIRDRLDRIPELTVRTYVLAQERRKAGQDWERLIEERYCQLEHQSVVVQRLEQDPAFTTVEQRAAEFMWQTGRSRATYFNVKRRLREAGLLPPTPSHRRQPQRRILPRGALRRRPSPPTRSP